MPASKLRAIILDRIQRRSAFKEDDWRGHHEKWLDLIKEGGDLVRSCIALDGFHNQKQELDPWHTDNQHKYMEDETTQLSAVAWR